MVLCACCTCGVMYIWCYVHDCTSGVVSIWCCVHVIHVVLCTSHAYGVVYMWCYVHVHVVLCTFGIVYMLYMWRCVHIVQVVLYTCDIVHTLCRCFYVQLVLCTCCTYGIDVHVVLCTCRRCCVAGMRYYVRALCSHGIVTCIHLLYYVYVFVLCCTPGVGVCIVLFCTLGVGVCVVCQV